MPSPDESFRTVVEVGDDRQRTVEPLSGTVTFLFTDIEGSTRLWEQHPQVMAKALAIPGRLHDMPPAGFHRVNQDRVVASHGHAPHIRT